MKAPLCTTGKAPRLPFICTPCRLRLEQTRGIAFVSNLTKLRRTTEKHNWKWKYGDKLKNAEEEWQAKATEIEEGKRDSMLSILEQRGFVNQVAGYKLSKADFDLLLMLLVIETS